MATALSRGAAFCLVLMACSAAPNHTPSGGAAGVRQPFPMVTASDVGPLANLSGVLEIRDGCLVVASDADTTYAVVWPTPGVSLRDDTLELHGVPLTVGGPVGLTGGEGSMGVESSAAIEWLERPHAGCLRQDAYWFATGVATIPRP